MPSESTSVIVSAVIFDLGGVLVDWNPRHLYRKLFERPADMEHFLANVCTPAWHNQIDAGRPMDNAIAELTARHPAKARLIAAYRDRWREMFRGEIEASVALLRHLYRCGVPLFALTNFPAEKFDDFRRDFPFTSLFEDIVVSGDEKIVKPDPRIYERALERFGLNPARTLFIDDRRENVAAARDRGLVTHHFQGSEALTEGLKTLGLL